LRTSTKRNVVGTATIPPIRVRVRVRVGFRVGFRVGVRVRVTMKKNVVGTATIPLILLAQQPLYRPPTPSVAITFCKQPGLGL